MGTPAFGARILAELIKVHEVTLVVTQPDRKIKRGKTIYNPVKELALAHGLKIFQPYNIKRDNDEIFKTECDLIVTAAYGQFVPMKLINYPQYRAINVHASLLPQYRGGAPIQRALMAGEKYSGISIIYMEKLMDSGDILAQEKLFLDEDETADSLFIRLASLGAKMILPVISSIEAGSIKSVAQNPHAVSYAYNLTKDDELISFNTEAQKIVYQIKGLSTNPGAYFVLEEKIYKLYAAKAQAIKHNAIPGTIIEVNKNSFTVACLNNTALEIKELKPEGKNLMTVTAFLNGQGRNIIVKNRRII